MTIDFSDYSVEVFIEANNTLGEGPIWWKSRNLLAWVDILECKIFAATWDGEIVDIITMPEPVGCIFEIPDGSLLAGCQTGLRTVPTGELIARIPDASTDMRINDGKVDPWGNLVFGTMGYPEPREGAGTLWRWDGSDFTALLEGLTIPNGMGWRRQGTEFLFTDTPSRKIRSYYYGSGSSITEQQASINLEEIGGVPDGLTILPDGSVAVVMWGSGSIYWCGDNVVLLIAQVPAVYATSIVGSPRKGQYVVTSAKDSGFPTGHGGSLFSISRK